MFEPNFQSEGTFTHDRLLAGDHPVRTRGIVVVTGQNLTRGAVLGKITASGKYTLCDPAAADGSQTPVGILMLDVDATAADADGKMYLSGDFNENAITIGGAGTADDVRDALRANSIYLHKAVSA